MCPSTPGCAENPCPADLTGDGQVNGLDLGHMLLLWQSANPIADIAPAPGGDGVVGGADLGALLLAWGDCR